MPYIEKENGNILARQEKYEEAIMHYNKSLFGMKMIFESEETIIDSNESAV